MLTDELRSAYHFKDDSINPRTGIYGVLFIAGLILIIGNVFMVGLTTDHQTALASPSDPVTHSDYEWSIPVGSPEIGVRPDGSIGSINEFGRISAV